MFSRNFRSIRNLSSIWGSKIFAIKFKDMFSLKSFYKGFYDEFLQIQIFLIILLIEYLFYTKIIAIIRSKMLSSETFGQVWGEILYFSFPKRFFIVSYQTISTFHLFCLLQFYLITVVAESCSLTEDELELWNEFDKLPFLLALGSIQNKCPSFTW